MAARRRFAFRSVLVLLAVGIGFDTLFFSVGRPPATDEDALAVAAEHFAVCPDNVWQNAVSFRDYAAEIKGRGVWTFWWD